MSFTRPLAALFLAALSVQTLACSAGGYAGAGAPPSPPRAAPGGATAADQAPAPARAEGESPTAAAEPSARPGLGTEWGETRSSRISTVPFLRADASPFATASLFYNDAGGARAMANATGFRLSDSGAVSVAGGAVSIGLRGEDGSPLRGFSAGGQSYVVGEAGRRYTIVLHNRSGNRLEAVLSVDGLDVIDGRPASFARRGYLVDPHGELEVDGFRQSNDTVAAFRFGAVRDSYTAQKNGDTRNVGVIGLALFAERGDAPPQWTPEEVERRRDADPFPARFATPPR